VSAESIASHSVSSAPVLANPSARDERALRLLSEASAALATSLDLDAMIDRVARVVVPTFANWCVIDLVDGDYKGAESPVRRAAAVHGDQSASRSWTSSRGIFLRCPIGRRSPGP
jgi:hypothetical protein